MGSPEDAKERFQKWKDKDPYTQIPSALLNSADIHDYIEATGMVYPYDPSLMKSSSYEARIGEYAYYWDENGEKKTIKLDKTSTVELKPNSLVFFETKEDFRLPSYMAIRFNLRITNVHRGLLLGTGPLVDPGFEGKLLIPIHNLTNNTYCFVGGENFIWIEFTKISPNEIWEQQSDKTLLRHGVYEPFPVGKQNIKPAAYFEKANNGNSIRNAVPAALFEAKKTANTAARSAKSAKRTVKYVTAGITAGGIITVLVMVASFYPLITDSMVLSKDVSKTISEFRKEYQEHLEKEKSSQTKIEALDGKIADMKLEKQTLDKISRQQIQIDALKEQIGALQMELGRYTDSLKTPNPARQ